LISYHINVGSAGVNGSWSDTISSYVPTLGGTQTSTLTGAWGNYYGSFPSSSTNQVTYNPYPLYPADHSWTTSLWLQCLESENAGSTNVLSFTSSTITPTPFHGLSLATGIPYVYALDESSSTSYTMSSSSSICDGSWYVSTNEACLDSKLMT
jgi:hypothetical protein